MATWKKVIVSGSQAHLQGITASNLTNNTAVPTAQIVGYNPTTGVLSYFNTSSIVNPNAFVQGGNSFGTTALLGTNDSQSLQLETSGSVRMTISGSGNIGIGTTTPIASLHVSGANNSNLLQISSPSATSALFVSGSGNVGIGTATPTNTLQVGGTGISTTNLTASALPTLAQVQVLGIDSSGNITKFSTSSIALPTAIDGAGVGQRLTMWSDNNTITTSSIVMTTEANPRFIVGHTDTGTSPIFAGRLNVSGSGGNEGIVVGSRVSTDVNSYGTYVFSDTEGPKIGFGSYTVGATTTPLSASWAQIGVYNQALRFEAFTTGSHQLTGGILFSYSGSNRPDLKISASNGATLVGINTATPTNTLQVGGGITAVNITASSNISSSAGLFGQTLATSGGATVGGNVVVTGDLAVNSNGIGITAVNITASNNLLVSNNLSVDGNTTLGNGAADTASITAGRVNISNLPVGSSELAVLVTGSGGQVFTRAIDSRAFGSTLVDATNGGDNRIATFTDANSLNGESFLTFDGTTFVVGASNNFTANTSGVVNAASITTTGNVVVGGDLTVNGETTIINTSTLSIEDKFIVLGRSSGSQVPASEGGIIVEGPGGSGSAFVFNSGSGGTNGLANRWGVALVVPTASMNVTPTDFMVTVSSSGVSPTDSNAPTFGSSSFGYGNMHINTTDGEIWIYV